MDARGNRRTSGRHRHRKRSVWEGAPLRNSGVALMFGTKYVQSFASDVRLECVRFVSLR